LETAVGQEFDIREQKNSVRNLTEVLTLPQRRCNRLHGNETAGPYATPWAKPPGGSPTSVTADSQTRAALRPDPSLAAASLATQAYVPLAAALSAASGEPAHTFHPWRDPQ